jgi:hypothetical protein
MRGVVVAANNVSHLDWHTVVIGVSVEQVGFSTFVGIGSISHDQFKAATIQAMRVDNSAAGSRDDVILLLRGGALPQNYFTQLVMRGTNNLDSIILQSSAASFGLTGPGLVDTFWTWTRSYHTTWPESLNGQRRQIRLI